LYSSVQTFFQPALISIFDLQIKIKSELSYQKQDISYQKQDISYQKQDIGYQK
jgi:hypothetical protein